MQQAGLWWAGSSSSLGSRAALERRTPQSAALWLARTQRRARVHARTHTWHGLWGGDTHTHIQCPPPHTHMGSRLRERMLPPYVHARNKHHRRKSSCAPPAAARWGGMQPARSGGNGHTHTHTVRGGGACGMVARRRSMRGLGSQHAASAQLPLRRNGQRAAKHRLYVSMIAVPWPCNATARQRATEIAFPQMIVHG